MEINGVSEVFTDMVRKNFEVALEAQRSGQDDKADDYYRAAERAAPFAQVEQLKRIADALEKLAEDYSEDCAATAADAMSHIFAGGDR